jgi:hypothetical protein
MDLPHMTTVWIVRQRVRFAWAMAGAARQLGGAGERLEVWLDAVAVAQRVDMRDMLAPLTEPLSEA